MSANNLYPIKEGKNSEGQLPTPTNPPGATPPTGRTSTTPAPTGAPPTVISSGPKQSEASRLNVIRQLLDQMHAEAIRDEEVTGGYYAHLKRTIHEARKLAEKHKVFTLADELGIAGQMIDRLRDVHVNYQGQPPTA